MTDQPLLFPVSPRPKAEGKPPVNAAKRQRLTKTYFTDEEYAQVVEKALACGKTVSVYLRETALGQEVKVRKLRHRDAVIRELSMVGTELRHMREQREDLSPNSRQK